MSIVEFSIARNLYYYLFKKCIIPYRLNLMLINLKTKFNNNKKNPIYDS